MSGCARVSVRCALFAGALSLGACASGAPEPEQQLRPAVQSRDGLSLLEHLTLTANRCWIRSGDRAFAAYSVAPELSSFSGRPRFLLVPRGRPEERPLLVVEGRSGSTAVDVYGPALSGAAASRITADVGRWSRGADSCSA